MGSTIRYYACTTSIDGNFNYTTFQKIKRKTYVLAQSHLGPLTADKGPYLPKLMAEPGNCIVHSLPWGYIDLQYSHADLRSQSADDK